MFGYPVSGPYFSPLTSPALQAQNDYSPLFDHSPSWATNSPVINTNHFAGSKVSPTKDFNSNNNIPDLYTRNSFRVRKSPVMKPNRRVRVDKNTSQSQGESDPSYLSTAHLQSNNYTPVTCGDDVIDSINSSEISSALAPPPLPPPALAAKCTDICAENSSLETDLLTMNPPATPASLMKINQSAREISNPNTLHSDDSNWTKSKDNNSQDSAQCASESNESNTVNNSVRMLEFEPLAAPSLTQVKLPLGESNLQGDKTKKSEILDTLSRKSPTSLRCSRKNKQINRLAPASPAILPRLSPSTKAMLCGSGKQSEDSVSLLLASKSNYQNILEGTQFSDAFYSPELSTNLTSKRTSHKLAEQGRRNRMNFALQEIATLLPQNKIQDSKCERHENCENGDTEGSYCFRNTSTNTTSKAKTVELAICYINFLKNQLEIANKKLEQHKCRQEM